MATTLITTYKPTVNSYIAIADDATNIAADTTNGNHYVYSQLTALFLHNTDDSAATVTIASNADSAGKTKTNTISIPAGDYCIVNLLDQDFQTGGYVTVTWTGTTPSGKIVPVEFIKP